MKSIDTQGKEYITQSELTSQLTTTDPKGLILWNKLGSLAELQASEIGPNGAWVGTPEYAAGKFDDGAYTDHYNDYINFSNVDVIDPKKCTLEMWIKTDFAVTNGNSPNRNDIFEMVSGGNDVSAIFHSSSGLWFMIGWAGGSILLAATSSLLTWPAGTLVHLAFVIDSSGIDGGSDTMRVYKDNQLVGSSTDTISMPVVTGFSLKLLRTQFAYRAQMVVDNFKAWDSALITFSWIDIENYGTREAKQPILPGIAGKVKEVHRINTGATGTEWYNVWRDLYLLDMGYFSKGGGVNKLYAYYTSGDYQGYINTITYKKGSTTLAVLTYNYTEIGTGSDEIKVVDYIDVLIDSITYRKTYTYNGDRKITQEAVTTV